MLLNVRSISVVASVITFFAISIIGLCSNLSPLTCCKRSLIAAVISYIVMMFAVKLINVILTNAVIDIQTKRQKEEIKHSGN